MPFFESYVNSEWSFKELYEKGKRICSRNHMWPSKPKIFTAWSSTEKVCQP